MAKVTPSKVEPRSPPIKHSSSAQAPTRNKRGTHSCPPPPFRGVSLDHTPPTSPARQPRRPHNDLLHIFTVEGDPDRDYIPRHGPYTFLVTLTSPWNAHGKCMIGVHIHVGAAISPTLLSPERYTRLHATHSRLHNATDFTQDLLRLMSFYHPRAKTLNPQGRSLKLANHWVVPAPLQQAIKPMFLSTSELFGSPLNCSMLDGITYCSAFPEDTIFGAITDSFQFRWNGSCIANPEYDPEDMLRAVLHALASSESSATPFSVVLILPVWDDTPRNSASIRGHSNMSTLIRIPTGHMMRFVPAHRQSDDRRATLPPSKWPVELVLISNETSREKYSDQSRIHRTLAPTIPDVCEMTTAQTKFFP